MGLNIVCGCTVHKERMWVLRGHEHAALRYWFFGPHSRCKDADENNVKVSHDQAGDDWMFDNRWRYLVWDGETAEPREEAHPYA